MTDGLGAHELCSYPGDEPGERCGQPAVRFVVVPSAYGGRIVVRRCTRHRTLGLGGAGNRSYVSKEEAVLLDVMDT